MTIGEKIKKARQLRGWTQKQLATILELPVSRIQQYESNVRNPKDSQLEEFAKALGVSFEYLKNHNLDSYNDIKHVLLELEDTFGLNITQNNDSYVIEFNDMELSDFLKQWYNAKANSKKSTQTLKDYELWKATYPESFLKESKEKLNKSKNID